MHRPQHAQVLGVRHPRTRSSAEPRRTGRPHRAQRLGPEAPNPLETQKVSPCPPVPLHPRQGDEATTTRSSSRKPRRPAGSCRAGRGISHAGQSSCVSRAQEPHVSQAACESSSLQGWMSRLASRDAAGVRKGCPASRYGNHHSLLQKKMRLFPPAGQLPPRLPRQISSAGCPQATAPAEQLHERHWQALVTTPAPFWRWFWGFFVANTT